MNPLSITKEKQSNSKRALGFIISNDRLIIGYISKNGAFCKVSAPVDLNNLSSEQFNTLVGSIPVVHGFSEENRKRLMTLVSNEELVQQLQTAVKSEQDLYINSQDQLFAIRKENADQIQKLNDLSSSYQHLN